MEKGGGSGCAACNNLFTDFLFLCTCWHFCLFLHNFEYFLHMFCVQIFKARSFASATFKDIPSLGAFPNSDSVGVSGADRV